MEEKTIGWETQASEAAKRVIFESAPERIGELEKIWNEYSPQFSLTTDKRGFSAEAGPFGLVLFTNRTMLQIWLLGFAAWKSLYSYSALFVILQGSKGKFIANEVNALKGQSEFDQEYDQLILDVRKLAEIENIDDFEWPNHVPMPDDGKPQDIEGSVVFDLVCMAAAYVFLHEVQHVKFQDGKHDDLDPVDEELACDKFAREILLGELEVYADQSGYPLEKLKTKRAMSIAIASLLLLVITPKESWGGSRSHPSVSNRIEQLVNYLQIPDNDTFWNFFSCLVLSQLRKEGGMPDELVFSSQKDLCLKLVGCLP